MNNKNVKWIIGIIALIILILLGVKLGTGANGKGGSADKAGKESAISIESGAEDAEAESGTGDKSKTGSDEGSDEESDKEDGEETDSDLCKVTIKNGASKANSNYAVNGLHVYDPTSEDLEDFADGVELPKGTNVSIYVYNLASEVHLKIVHNGKVIADKDYSILESDEDVEFFDFELEGDLEVTTEVINSKAKDGIATVYISNDTLADVTIGAERITNNVDIYFGTHDWKVTAKNADIVATLKVGKKTIGTQTIKAGKSYTFKVVKVNGDVFLSFEYASAAEAAAAEKAKSQDIGTTGTGNPTITVVNATGDPRVTLNVRYLDSSLNVHEVVSGKEYPVNMLVFSRVINASPKTLRLTATMNGTTVGSAVINPKPANDDATYYGLPEIALKGNLTYYLSVINNGSESQDGGKEDSGKEDSGKEDDGKEDSGKEDGDTKKKAKITINNGAASANTDDAVNGLHLYDPASEDMDDIKSGTYLPIGTKLSLYAYNTASDIHLTVVHNGKTIVDKDYEQIQTFVDDDKVEFFDITLAGDLVITTKAIDEAHVDPDPVDPVDPDPVVPEVKYTVDIDNQTDAEMNVRYVDFSGEEPAAVTVNDGDKVAEGTELFAQIINSSDKALKLTVKAGSEVVATASIAAGTVDEPSYGGIMNPPIVADKDLKFVLEEVDEESEKNKVTVTVNNEAASANTEYAVNGLHVYDTESWDDINGTAEFEIGTEIELYVYNVASPVHLTVVHDGVTIVDKDYDVFEPYVTDTDFIDVTLTGDLVVTATAIEQEPEHTVNIVNDLGSDVVLNVRYVDFSGETPQAVDVNNGDKVAEGTELFAQVINSTDKELKLYVRSGKEEVTNASIGAGTADEPAYGGIMEPVAVDKDLTFIIEEAEAEEPVEFTVNVNERSLTWGIYLDGTNEIADGDKVEAGTHSFEVYAADTDVNVTLTAGGKEIGTKRIAAVDSATFEDVTVDGDLSFTFALAEGEEEEQEPEHTVNIVNDLGSDVVLNVRYVDFSGETPQAVDVNNGDKVKEGTELFAQVINSTDKELKLYVRSGKEEVTTAGIEAGTADEPAYGGIMEPVAVDKDLTFIIEEAEAEEPVEYTVSVNDSSLTWGIYLDGADEITDGGKVEAGTHSFEVYAADSDVNVTLTVDGKEIGTKRIAAVDSATFEDVTVDGDISFAFKAEAEGEEKEEEKTTATVTVINKAAEANTSDAVNAVHVYDADSADMEDVADTAEFALGTKMEVYVYNLASDVHLKIEHNGKVVVDKDYGVMEAWVDDDKIEFHDFVLEGDLTVTVTVAGSAENEDTADEAEAGEKPADSAKTEESAAGEPAETKEPAAEETAKAEESAVDTAEAPAEATTEVPVEAPVESTTEVPVETPTEAPAEVAAQEAAEATAAPEVIG